MSSWPHGLRVRVAQRAPIRLATALAILAASWLDPGQARAQCAPPDPLAPLVIECSGNDPDGFDAGLDDDVTLTVLGGATVSNGANTDTIRLNDGSEITMDSAADVINDAANGIAASLGDNGSVFHNGMIFVSGNGGVGIAGQNGNSLNTTLGSMIDLLAPDTTGIQALDGAPAPDGSPDGSSRVANDGDIGGSEARSVGIRVGSYNLVDSTGSITLSGSDSTGMQLAGDNNTLSNAGAVTLIGDGSVGVELAGNDNRLTNSSLSVISVTGANGVGVLAGVGGTENNTVLNAGSISVGATGGPAVSFAPSGTMGANVLDSLLGSTIDAGAGTAVLGGAGSEILFGSGEIIGDVDLAGGDDVVQLFEGGSVTGPIDLGPGDDSFELFEGGVFSSVDGGAGIDALLLGSGPPASDTLDFANLAGFETLELTGGDWTLRGNGTFSNGITLTNGVARIAEPVSLTGNLLVSANAADSTASRLEVADTLSLTGDYQQAAGSTLTTVLDPLGVSGSVRATGSATIEPGVALGLVEATPLGNTESFTILAALGGINGTFTDLPASTAVLSFSVNTIDVAVGQELVLDIARSTYASAASTPNQRAVGGALDGVLIAGSTGDMQNLLTSLDQVSSAAYGAALDTLHPEAYDAQTSATLGFGLSFARMAASNLVACEPFYYKHLPDWITGGPPCNKDGWTPWAGGFGNFWNRDGSSGHIDYDGQGGGFAIGAGRSFGENWQVSGYFGGGLSWLTVADVGDGNFQMIDVGVAAVRRIGAVSLRSVVDYGHGWHQQDRNVVLDSYLRKTTGDFGSDRVTGLLEASYNFDAAGVVLEPVASADFTWLSQESFSESGGQAASLAVDERSQTVVGTTLGLRIETSLIKHRYVTDLLPWANGVWRPELDVRWRANWTDVDRDITGSFVEAPAGTGRFTVEARDAKQGAEIAAGTTFQPYKTRVLVSAGYRGFIGDGSQIHSVGAEVRVPF